MIELTDISHKRLRIDRLEIPKGYTCIIGENGSSKSTLAKLIAGLEVVERGCGDISVDGVFPREIDTGYVPEFFDRSIIFEEVYDEISSPLRFSFIDPETADKKVNETAAELGIAHLLNRKTSKLSGGEKAFVSLATALVSSPKVLVLDEPDSHTDYQTSKDLTTALKRQNIEYIIHCTHDIERANESDFVVFLKDGAVADSGKPKEIFSRLSNSNDPRLSAFTPVSYKKEQAMGKTDSQRDSNNDSKRESNKDSNVESNVDSNVESNADLGTNNLQIILKDFEIKRGNQIFSADCSFTPGIYVISGKVGSGKTTFAHALAEYGFNKYYDTCGEIQYRGIKSRMMLMQFAGYHITKNTVFDEIMSWVFDEKIADEILKFAELESQKMYDPAILSAGELKRLYLACILYPKNTYDLLILDEPFSTLDIIQKEKFCGVINDRYSRYHDNDCDTPKDRGILIIFTHERTILPKTDYICEVTDHRLIMRGRADYLNI